MRIKVYRPGMVLGRITLIEEEKLGHKNFWKVQCQCGNQVKYRTDYISRMKSEGKMFECTECKYNRRYPSLCGNVYGRLTVLKEVPSNTKDTRWLVRCECGVEKTIISSRLTAKWRPTKSCGCLGRKLNSKWVNTTQYPPAHQLKTKLTEKLKLNLYHCRNAMVASCYNENDSRFPHHGKLGHTVCELWRNGAKDFVKWCIKNKYKKGDAIFLKEGCTEFNPKNCIIKNKGEFFKINNSKFVSYQGKTQSITDWAIELGCTISCLSQRLQKYSDESLDKIMDLNWIRKSKRKYGTEHYESLVVELYLKGKTYFEIIEEIGCSASTIKRFLKKNNISIRPAATRSSKLIKDRIEEIKELKNLGKSFKEISDILGIKEQNVSYHYRKLK